MGVFAIVWGMAVEKIKGLASLVSNDPTMPTGYGVQAGQLVEQMKKHGIHIGVLSNYGTEGNIRQHRTKYGDVPIYPKGLKPYSDDVIELWHNHHRAQHPRLPHAIFTLYDVWVYNALPEMDTPIYCWVPLDHITLPPLVKKFLDRPNVHAIAMSPHGQRQLKGAGIESVYIPHAVNTDVFVRTEKFRGQPTREFMDIKADDFLVSMVMANKANGMVHRKAYAEQLLAFGIFHKEHPDSHLYIHADPLPLTGGFHLGDLLKSCGVPASAVTIANRDELKTGYSDQEMAAIYSATDVLMMATYGEGFGVPVIEAQACGTRVITSSWAATPDLVSEDSFLVEGQPFWDEPQKSFFQIPLLGSMVSALERAYNADRGPSVASRQFALGFGVETVFERDWVPFLREVFA